MFDALRYLLVDAPAAALAAMLNYGKFLLVFIALAGPVFFFTDRFRGWQNSASGWLMAAGLVLAGCWLGLIAFTAVTMI